MGIIDEPCFASRTEMQNIFEPIFISGYAINSRGPYVPANLLQKVSLMPLGPSL